MSQSLAGARRQGVTAAERSGMPRTLPCAPLAAPSRWGRSLTMEAPTWDLYLLQMGEGLSNPGDPSKPLALLLIPKFRKRLKS